MIEPIKHTLIQQERCEAAPELADFIGHDKTGHLILNAMLHRDINTIAKLRDQSDRDIYKMENLGKAALARIRELVPEPPKKFEPNKLSGPGSVELSRYDGGMMYGGVEFVIIERTIIIAIRESEMPKWLTQWREREREFAIYAIGSQYEMVPVQFIINGYEGQVVKGHGPDGSDPYTDWRGREVVIPFKSRLDDYQDD